MGNPLRWWWTPAVTAPIPPDDVTPHIVIFAAPAQFDHRSISIRKYRGLLSVQAFGAGTANEGRIITTWRDGRAFRAAMQDFNADTKLDLPPAWEGYYLSTRTSTGGVGKYLSVSNVWAILATAALLLTYAEKARDGYGWLAEPPRIRAAAVKTTDVLAGDAFTLKVDVFNERQLGDCVIEFDAPTVGAEAPVSLDEHPGRRIPGVKPGGAATITLSGKALQQGSYCLPITGRAWSGLFAREARISLEPEIHVWSPWSVSEGRLRSSFDGGRLCEFEFDLKSGRRFAKGLQLQAHLARVAGVRFSSVRFPGTVQFNADEPVRTPQQEVAAIDWVTPELPALRLQPFTLVLEHEGPDGKSADEWTGVGRAIQFDGSEVP